MKDNESIHVKTPDESICSNDVHIPHNLAVDEKEASTSKNKTSGNQALAATENNFNNDETVTNQVNHHSNLKNDELNNGEDNSAYVSKVQFKK